MGGMKFEYDEEGGTFYYFLLSFIALVLFPATYYLWPGERSKDDKKKKLVCYCEPCQIKRKQEEQNQPRKKIQQRIIKFVLVIGWIFFIYIAYKTSQVELDFKEFDPYAELGIDRGAEVSEIKKAYRKLSLIYHPDRETGDSHKFMRITKAHDALTDEEARKNWEEYGNPDGPGATQVGIALPKWIVEKQNSIWVLGLYALVFMFILPICVGTWWYRSIKYSAQQVLIDTTRMYYQFLRKSPNMILKRVILVLSGSYEFYKRFNSEIVERPSDNVEIPELIRDLPQFIQNNRELPFYIPYSLKARALLVAHFSGKKLSSSSLEYDKDYILKKCPYLLSEMLSLAQQLYYLSHADKVPYKLSLDTVDNIMKVSQMIIQGLWFQKSPLLQLPHVTEDMLRHFVTKRRSIRSIKELASMTDEDRRALMRQLSDREYQNVMTVLSMMPYNVEMTVTCEVKGEDDKTITAGSFVTVAVKLNRNSSTTLVNMQQTDMEIYDDGCGEPEEDNEDEEDDSHQLAQLDGGNQTQARNRWQKNKKKRGGNKKPRNKKMLAKTAVVKKTVEEEKDTPPASNNVTPKSNKPGDAKKANPSKTSEHEVINGASSGDESAGNSSDEGEMDVLDNGGINKVDEDEDEWMAFQKESRKENILETKSKETHIVHCPHYPSEKYEWWWLYLADMKKKQLISGPLQVTTLREAEEKELRFTAPYKPGTYQYSVVLRSDSYLGMDQIVNIKVDVKEAKKMAEPKWESSDEEGKNKKELGSESEESSEGDESDDGY